jgi:hypothetical protein
VKEQVSQSWCTNNDNGEAKQKTKESKESKESTVYGTKNNPPDRNGGNLPCDGGQLLNAAGTLQINSCHHQHEE